SLDIVKITLNANADSYYPKVGGADVDNSEILRQRIKALEDKLQECFPEGTITEEMMLPKEFPYALTLIVMHNANLAMREQSGLSFQPLAIFSYADGQTMLTIAGILLEDDTVQDFFDCTGIERWDLSNTDWSEPKEIGIPDFTVKEKIAVDSLLPSSDKYEIHKKLGILFHESPTKSEKLLDTYIAFYRQSPYFSSVSI
ncbi:MAG: hypothetical protein F6K30_29530, partial [Cyanothece sp. SIO2G6]|nr:hypothetical protein [Cyanothece sp. SIO2G6]